MKPCSRCRRHVRRSEPACPFCGAALHDALAPAQAAWGLGLLGVMVFTAACGPGKPSGTGDETGDPDDSTTLVTPTTGVPDPTTTSSGESTSGSASSASSSDECGTACDDSFESGAFIYAPWDGGDPDECDNFTQDCPVGQKCAAWAEDGGTSWNALKCVPVVEDPKQPGEPCTAEPGVTGVDDCDVGVMCWDLDAELMGTCVPLCTGTVDMPLCDDPAATCALFNDDVLNLCLPSCDPLLQDCPDDDVCIPNMSAPGFLCVLTPTDQSQQHDPCDFANSCDNGLFCTDNTAADECDENFPTCCQPFCDLTDPDVVCSGVGQECIPFFPMGDAPEGLDDVGFCSLPPP